MIQNVDKINGGEEGKHENNVGTILQHENIMCDINDKVVGRKRRVRG